MGFAFFFTWLRCSLSGHEWGAWQYMEDGSCTQERRCLRCPNGVEKRDDHQWGDWELLPAETCKYARDCMRCPVGRTTTIEHAFTSMDHASHKCQLCSVIEQHRWIVSNQGADPTGFPPTNILECTGALF